MSEKKAQPIFEEEQQPDAEQSLIHIADHEDSRAAGDYSTQIMQEKTEPAGDFPTENDKKPLFECMLCGKVTEHGFFDCPNRERIRKLYSYCMVCNKKTDHGTLECPSATEDVLICSICDKNTDHDTFDVTKENGSVLYDGAKVPNVCDLCREVGHMDEECPYGTDSYLECGLDLCEDEWLYDQRIHRAVA